MRPTNEYFDAMDQRAYFPESTSTSASNATRRPVIHKHIGVPRRIGTKPNPPQQRHGISQVLSLMVMEDETYLGDKNEASRHRWRSLLTVRVQLLTGRLAVGYGVGFSRLWHMPMAFLQLAPLVVATPFGSAPHATARLVPVVHITDIYICRETV